MEKLSQYRDSVRKHYSDLREGVREGLPTDLARPLSVGQRVIAIHPKTGDIHDGSILTVDHSRCHVQFDNHELGVEFIMVRCYYYLNCYFRENFRLHFEILCLALTFFLKIRIKFEFNLNSK